MAEWFEKYRGASEREVVAQALDACARRDCALLMLKEERGE